MKYLKLFENFEYLPENWQIVLKEVNDLKYILEDMGYEVNIKNRSISELPDIIVFEIDTFLFDENGHIDSYKTRKIFDCPEFQEFFDRIKEVSEKNILHTFFTYPGAPKIWICNKSEKEMNGEK